MSLFAVQTAAEPADVDADAFRAAFRRLAGGVSVITVGRGDERTGLTVTSVSSLSSTPPLLTFNISSTASAYGVLVREQAFGVNILKAAQQHIAERFSGVGGIKGVARFAGAQWVRGVTGVPLLSDALASIECTLEELVEFGSHAVVVGRIKGAYTSADSSALLYWHGRYESLGWSREEADLAAGLRSF